MKLGTGQKPELYAKMLLLLASFADPECTYPQDECPSCGASYFDAVVGGGRTIVSELLDTARDVLKPAMPAIRREEHNTDCLCMAALLEVQSTGITTCYGINIAEPAPHVFEPTDSSNGNTQLCRICGTPEEDGAMHPL